MEFCKKSCAEKAAEICNKNSEIEKLESNFKDAKEEIVAKVNELQQRESELTVLNKKFETATSAIEENNKTIQVTLCCCLKHFPHFTVISCQKFLLKLPNQYSYTFFHRKPLKVFCFSYCRWVNYLLVPHFTKPGPAPAACSAPIITNKIYFYQKSSSVQKLESLTHQTCYCVNITTWLQLSTLHWCC